MRTTVTLTREAHDLIRRSMEERNISFKEAVNAAIVSGLKPGADRAVLRTEVEDLGRARVPVVKALQLAAELEDEELARKWELGK